MKHQGDVDDILLAAVVVIGLGQEGRAMGTPDLRHDFQHVLVRVQRVTMVVEDDDLGPVGALDEVGHGGPDQL